MYQTGFVNSNTPATVLSEHNPRLGKSEAHSASNYVNSHPRGETEIVLLAEQRCDIVTYGFCPSVPRRPDYR